MLVSFTFYSVAWAQRWGRNANSKQDQQLLKRNVIEIQNQKAGFSVGIHQQEVSGTISDHLVAPDAPEMILGTGRSKKRRNTTCLWKLQKTITREEEQLQLPKRVVQLPSQQGNVNTIHRKARIQKCPLLTLNLWESPTTRQNKDALSLPQRKEVPGQSEASRSSQQFPHSCACSVRL